MPNPKNRVKEMIQEIEKRNALDSNTPPHAVKTAKTHGQTTTHSTVTQPKQPVNPLAELELTPKKKLDKGMREFEDLLKQLDEKTPKNAKDQQQVALSSTKPQQPIKGSKEQALKELNELTNSLMPQPAEQKSNYETLESKVEVTTDETDKKPLTFDDILDGMDDSKKIIEINPLELNEQSSQILGEFLLQNPSTTIFNRDDGKNRIYTVNLQRDGATETVSFKLTHTLLRRESEKKKNTERGDYRWEVINKNESKGEGAYGVVYSTKTLAVEQGVAKLTSHKRVIKIQKAQEETEAFAKRIQNEHKSTSYMKEAIFRHVKAEESKKEKSVKAYSIMENFPGVELFKILEEYDLTAAQRLSLSQAVIKAYEEQVFKRGLVHCDIKTENVLVKLPTPENPDLIVNFIDYGVAKGINEVIVGEIRGTPTYMSPEVLRSENASTASDIFSLGVLLWEIAGANMDISEWLDKDSSQNIRYDNPYRLAADLQIGRILYRQFPQLSANLKDRNSEIEATVQNMSEKMVDFYSNKRPSIPEVLKGLEMQAPSEKEIWAKVAKRESTPVSERGTTDLELSIESLILKDLEEEEQYLHEKNEYIAAENEKVTKGLKNNQDPSYPATANSGGEGWDDLFEEMGITDQEEKQFKESSAELNNEIIDQEPLSEQRRIKAEQTRKASREQYEKAQEEYEEAQKLKKIEEELELNNLVNQQKQDGSVSEFDNIIDTLDFGDSTDSSELPQNQNKQEFQELSPTQLPEVKTPTLADLDDLLSDEIYQLEDGSELDIKIKAEFERDFQRAELAALPSIRENVEKVEQAFYLQKLEIKKPSPEKVQQVKTVLSEQSKQRNNLDPDAQAGFMAKFLAELASKINKRYVPETEPLLPVTPITDIKPTNIPTDPKKLKYLESRDALLAELKSKKDDLKPTQPASKQQPGKLTNDRKQVLENALGLILEKRNAPNITKQEKVEHIKPTIVVSAGEDAAFSPNKLVNGNETVVRQEALLTELQTKLKKVPAFAAEQNEVAAKKDEIDRTDAEIEAELEALQKEREEDAGLRYPLWQIIKDYNLTSEQRLQLSEAVLQAYQNQLKANQSQIPITSDNILIKFPDAGNSKPIASFHESATDDSAARAKFYSSPEELRNERAFSDSHTYSLGIILAEIWGANLSKTTIAKGDLYPHFRELDEVNGIVKSTIERMTVIDRLKRSLLDIDSALGVVKRMQSPSLLDDIWQNMVLRQPQPQESFEDAPVEADVQNVQVVNDKQDEKDQTPTVEDELLSELQIYIGEIRDASKELSELADRFEKTLAEKRITYDADFKDDIRELINDGLDRKLQLPETEVKEGRELLEQKKAMLAKYDELLRARPGDLELRNRAEQIKKINLDSLQDVPSILDELYHSIQEKTQYINEVLREIHEDQSELRAAITANDNNSTQVNENEMLHGELVRKMSTLKWKITNLEDGRIYRNGDKDFTKKDFSDLLIQCNEGLKLLKQEEPSFVKNQLTDLLDMVEGAIDITNGIKIQANKEEAEEDEARQIRLQQVDAKIERSRVKKEKKSKAPPEEAQALFERFKQELLKKTENKRASAFDDNLLGKTTQLIAIAKLAYRRLQESVEKTKEALDKGVKFGFEKNDLDKLFTGAQTEFNQLEKDLLKQQQLINENPNDIIQAKYKLGMNGEHLSQLIREMNAEAERLDFELIRANTVRERVPQIEITNVAIAVAANIPDQSSSVVDDNDINNQLDSILEAIEAEKVSDATQINEVSPATIATKKLIVEPESKKLSKKPKAALFGDKGVDKDFMESLLKWNSLQNTINEMNDGVVVKNKSGTVKHTIEKIYDVMSKVGDKDSRFDVLIGCLMKQSNNLDESIVQIKENLTPHLDSKLNSKRFIILIDEILQTKKDINELLEGLLEFKKSLNHPKDMRDSDFINIFDDFEKNFRVKEIQQEKWKLLADFVLEELSKYEQASCKIKGANKESDVIRELIKNLDAKVMSKKEPIPAEEACNILIGGLIEKREAIIKAKSKGNSSFTVHFFKKSQPFTFDEVIERILEREIYGKAKGALETFDSKGMFKGRGINYDELHKIYANFEASSTPAAPAA